MNKYKYPFQKKDEPVEEEPKEEKKPEVKPEDKKPVEDVPESGHVGGSGNIPDTT